MCIRDRLYVIDVAAAAAAAADDDDDDDDGDIGSRESRWTATVRVLPVLLAELPAFQPNVGYSLRIHQATGLQSFNI